jgi:hypothetical protein
MQDVQEMLRTLPHAVTPRPAGADVAVVAAVAVTVTAPPGAGTAPSAALPTSAAVPAGGKARKASDPGSYVGKIAVMLQGMSELPSGSQPTQVTINGKQGQLGFAEGGTAATRAEWLIFPDSAGHKVLVQVPASLGLTQAQIVSFAQGITVTKAAKAAAG